MIREKKRYLLLKIVSPRKFDETTAKHLVYHSVFSFLGEDGAAKAKVKMKLFDADSQKVVVKCALSELERVIAALALLRKYDGQDVALRLEKISGAIANVSVAEKA